MATKIVLSAAVMMLVLMLGYYQNANIAALGSLCNMDEAWLNLCKPSAMKQPAPVELTADCCQALKGADLSCLCSYKNSTVLLSLGIDPELAMALPANCCLIIPEGCRSAELSR